MSPLCASCLSAAARVCVAAILVRLSSIPSADTLAADPSGVVQPPRGTGPEI
ncbi:MAG: hypothetical protein JXR37_19025 [Kiritimatiellae bacterium]|nr:hypothetical protein [Kiritimatiellia bacterium]